MKMILKAEQISKSYRTQAEEIPVLVNLDLELSAGELVVIMGPSGAGKSTLLHILGLIDRYDTGNLTVGEHIINPKLELADIRAREIGFVFQYHHLLPEFTVLENLLIPQALIGRKPFDARTKANDFLDFMGLSNRAAHYPSQISGGEKQRVAVLRALVNEPQVILADEPTGNLDEENSQILLNLIMRLRDEFKQSFIIATHDRTVAEIADRVLYLSNGKLEFKKDPRQKAELIHDIE